MASRLDDAAAKDLVQEVLITVLQALRAGEVRELDRLGSSVLGTCRFVVRNQRRTDARRRAILNANPLDNIDPTMPPRPFDRARLEHCLGTLSEGDRSVVVLSFYAERSADEVADDIGTTRDARQLGEVTISFTVFDVRDDGEHVLGRYTLAHHP